MCAKGVFAVGAFNDFLHALDGTSDTRRALDEMDSMMKRMENNIVVHPDSVNPFKELLAYMKQQTEELHRQSNAQEKLIEELREESRKRAHDDTKYFWIGALISFLAAMLVEHGGWLLMLLRGLLQKQPPTP